MKAFAQKIQKRHARIIELDPPLHAVHGQSH
jgi:hypothetical protein